MEIIGYVLGVFLASFFVYKVSIEPIVLDIRRNKFKNFKDKYYENSTLYLREESLDAIRDFIKVVPVNTITISHEPKQIHFGAATVGGVTTGGTYETGGYNYISGANKTGLYSLELVISKRDVSQIVRTIKLSPKYLSLARENETISKFIKDDTIVVVEEVNYNEAEKAEALATATMLAYNQTGTTSKLMYKGYPNFAKANDILNWIKSL